MTRTTTLVAHAFALALVACGGTPATAPAPERAPAPTPEAVGGAGDAEKPYALPAWPAFDAAIRNGTRTPTGTPGPRYWQQYATYRLEAELVPVTKRLIGKGTVTYRNRSPDTLPVLFVHAYPNLFHPNAKRNTNVMSALGGMVFTHVGVAGRALDSTATGAGWTVTGTVMELRLPAPLAPGAEVTVEFGWNYRVPPDGAPRGGQDREAYVLSYWYPQVAVYDDVNGWQADQYLGNAEFYMGYADYEVALTVPAGWLVASTGELVNADEVLAPAVRERLARARASGAVVNVVTEPERGAGPGKATAAGTDGKLTWRFRATNVRDVTWGTSGLWLWDAGAAEVGDVDGDARPDSALVSAFYRPDRRRGGWGDAVKFGQHSLALFSRRLWPYPWPHMDVVDGPASCGGMEYPMLTCIGGNWDPRALYETEAHEIAHMWFPMVVGSDEKRFAWQDEGMAQHFQAYAINDFYRSADDFGESRRNYLEGTQVGETELMRHGDRYPNYFHYGVASYYKPAAVLQGLRAMLGDSLFTAAFREYGRRWAYKHPTPRDFFATVDDVAQRDLDWFWRSWYYETWRLDQRLDEVVLAGDSARVTVTSQGRVPMPVFLVARGAAGDSTTTTVPAQAFLAGLKTVTVSMPLPKDVVRIDIDPGRMLPDADPRDQTWPRTAEDLRARRPPPGGPPPGGAPPGGAPPGGAPPSGAPPR